MSDGRSDKIHDKCQSNPRPNDYKADHFTVSGIV